MSKAIMRGKPAARATARAPTTPAAGPDRTVRMAMARAAPAEMEPPLDCITCNREADNRRSRLPR